MNKDPIQNLQLTVQLPQLARSASLVEMTQLSEGAAGPDLTAIQGVTIQGASVNLGSPFSAGAGYTLIADGSQLNCYVPALSAVLIRIVPTSARTNLGQCLRGGQGRRDDHSPGGYATVYCLR